MAISNSLSMHEKTNAIIDKQIVNVVYDHHLKIASTIWAIYSIIYLCDVEKIDPIAAVAGLVVDGGHGGAVCSMIHSCLIPMTSIHDICCHSIHLMKVICSENQLRSLDHR